MLRAIIRRRHKDQCTGLEIDDLETIDFHSEVLEEALGSGGYSESGYEHRSIAGVEILGRLQGSESDNCNLDAHHEGICKCPRCQMEGLTK